jgi:hypothetical protein
LIDLPPATSDGGVIMHDLIQDEVQSAGVRKMAVLYESTRAREYLYRMFDQLETFCAKDENCAWCSTRQLHAPRQVQEFFNEALDADLVIFTGSAEGELSPEVKKWFDWWSSKRADREGAIAGIFHDPTPRGVVSRKEIYLRAIAHQAGLDYLSTLPNQIGRAMPDSLDTFCARAGQMTSVLDQILRRRIPPQLPNPNRAGQPS